MNGLHDLGAANLRSFLLCREDLALFGAEELLTFLRRRNRLRRRAGGAFSIGRAILLAVTLARRRWSEFLLERGLAKERGRNNFHFLGKRKLSVIKGHPRGMNRGKKETSC